MYYCLARVTCLVCIITPIQQCFIEQCTLTDESFQEHLPGGVHIGVVRSSVMTQQFGNFCVDLDISRFLGVVITEHQKQILDEFVCGQHTDSTAGSNLDTNLIKLNEK